MVQFILFGVPLLDILWCAWAWWRAGRLPGKAVWRGVVVGFFILMITHFAWMLLQRRAHLTTGAPALTMGMAYIWHLLILPVLSALILSGELLIGAFKSLKLIFRTDAAVEDVPPPPASGMSRRGFLTMAAIAAPPAFTLATGIGGYQQIQRFRIREMDVAVPGLPKALEGATIAHLSDVHAGKFTDIKTMARMAAATNDLRADLILMTGDLIDFSLNDLPNATDAMRRLDAPGGVYICEGNHDLFEDRKGFEQGVRNSGLEILINQTANINLRGHDVQIHGLRWGAEGGVHGFRQDGGASINIDKIKEGINPDAFSILLAHHPHAFDVAAAAGIPITFSGHTHGGQLNLTDHIGVGALMYKYWSGLYNRGDSRLVVSNGVGNWLPLRINAPAEIVHVTLRSA